MIEIKRQIAEIEEKEVDTIEAEDKLKEAKIHWQDIIQNGKKHRDDKLLDLYNTKIEGEDKEIIKRRNKTLKKLKKNEYRRWMLKYLTENVG